jgi:hypothetical protein
MLSRMHYLVYSYKFFRTEFGYKLVLIMNCHIVGCSKLTTNYFIAKLCPISYTYFLKIINVHLFCVCVCVCERERERERDDNKKYIFK